MGQQMQSCSALRAAFTGILVVRRNILQSQLELHGFCMAVRAVININVTMTTSKVCIVVKHCLRSVQVRNRSQMQHVSRLELCRQAQKVLLGSSSSDCQVCY